MVHIEGITKIAQAIDENTVEWSLRPRSQRTFPDGAWNPASFFGHYTSIDHPFLQKLIDYKAQVTVVMGEITILAHCTMAILHVCDGFVAIECISTPSEFRREGSGSKVMKALVTAADETGTELRLRTANVTGGWFNMLPDHPVIMKGKDKKNKIPTARLAQWYARFGFHIVGKIPQRNIGSNMQYIPKSKATTNELH